MTPTDPLLRVSVATLNRVVFTDARGIPILALERKATLLGPLEENNVQVLAQPFGGAVRIRDLAALDELGEWRFDSPRSQSEQDFRLLIPPDRWGLVRQFCLSHLANPDDPILETGPHRELAEEFADALKIDLSPQQYRLDPVGFVIEDRPSPTQNVSTPGCPTARIYRVFTVQIVDPALCRLLQENSARYSDFDLQNQALADAADGGRGRANAVLTLPLEQMIAGYRALPLDARYGTIRVGGFTIDASTAAVLPEIEITQFERIAG